MNKYDISTSQAAEILGISRVAVFKRIKKGDIKARKVGRNYIIDKRSLGTVFQDITPQQKKAIDAAVDRVVEDFGEALRKLGRE
ncbi:MAG: helix-turn-helix domain-containing protein [Actinomycetota bacterium]